MKIMHKILILFFTVSILVFPSDRKVLVEIFTNSNCPLCPPAHTAMKNYVQNSGNASKIEYIFYNIRYPYPTDKLYQDNTTDSDAKYKDYLNSSGGNPAAFFDGKRYANSFDSWGSTLDNLETQESPFEITLSGNYTSSDFSINAEITQTGENSNTDLTVNFVVVEDVTYTGGNGVSDHKHVMRKIANIDGDPINISMNETKNLSATFNMNSLWNTDNLKVVVYIQSKNTKTVYQSEGIDYSSLILTDVTENSNLPNKFQLYQNYPNPFNPTTTIKYTIPANVERQTSEVRLLVYDVLGNEIKTLVNKAQQAGNYEIQFDASEIPSGIYFYRLNFGNLSSTKKMILVK